ncbi:MAG TPA: hypothetical protein VNS09_07305 [Solirubrobacter sp.]|nr:hypothetical protein [Solirubrobacter sp.]
MRSDPEFQLAVSDLQTFADRAERLRWLQGHGEPAMGRMFFGGPLSAFAFHEAGVCYVAGLYLGCVLLAQTCLEHLLGGAFTFWGPEEAATYPYRRMLKEAREAQILTADEYELFDRLRKERNPYAHPRGIDDPMSLLRRAMTTGQDPEGLLQKDAREALTAVVQLVNRAPFGLSH